MHSCAMYLYYKYSVLKIEYKCIIPILSFDMCLGSNIKVFDSMLPKVTTQFSRNWKNFETLQELFVKHDNRGSSFCRSLHENQVVLKKLPIFGKRKLRGIFLRKKLNFDFSFEKLDFLRRGALNWNCSESEYCRFFVSKWFFDLRESSLPRFFVFVEMPSCVWFSRQFVFINFLFSLDNFSMLLFGELCDERK